MIKEEQQLDELIAGCKIGNGNAQEKLYRHFYRVMINLCLRYTKNDMDAMDALNTGFYKVFKNIQWYDPEKASLYTWIRTIVINSCLDLGRSKATIIQPSELKDAAAAEIEPEVISKLSAAHLLEIVRLLPQATQAVFNLYIMEGYSHKEIAGLLKISEGTSKWHLSDARKKLQTMLNKEQY
ncbi:MAG: sigma-70 family RNA polymerase sigma factor [Ferruginibacter sp.]